MRGIALSNLRSCLGLVVLLGLFVSGVSARAQDSLFTVRDIRIEGDAGAPLQADGDIIAHLPVQISALPNALRMVTAG